MQAALGDAHLERTQSERLPQTHLQESDRSRVVIALPGRDQVLRGEHPDEGRQLVPAQIRERHPAPEPAADLHPGPGGESHPDIVLLPAGEDDFILRPSRESRVVEILAFHERAVHGVGGGAQELAGGEVLAPRERRALLIGRRSALRIGEESPGRRRLGLKQRGENLLLASDFRP